MASGIPAIERVIRRNAGFGKRFGYLFVQILKEFDRIFRVICFADFAITTREFGGVGE
jgi:hypothetical protein